MTESYRTVVIENLQRLLKEATAEVQNLKAQLQQRAEEDSYVQRLKDFLHSISD